MSSKGVRRKKESLRRKEKEIERRDDKKEAVTKKAKSKLLPSVATKKVLRELEQKEKGPTSLTEFIVQKESTKKLRCNMTRDEARKKALTMKPIPKEIQSYY